MDWFYQQPVNIVFGNGKIAETGELIKKLGGTNGLLVCDKFLADNGAADKVMAQSGGLLKYTFSNVSPNPDVKEVDACADFIRANGIDFVAAMGGGSVMDCAKAASSVCTTSDSIVKYHGTGVALPPTKLPLICIPTTAGTGSEVTCVSVLTNHELGKKAPINCDNFYAAYAIIDPELTYTVPPKITANTGMDVLCHALEGYWSKGHQPICDACAVHAAELVFKYLPVCYRDSENGEAREKMCEASVIAGLAFTLPKTTSSHACSFPLTNLYHIPHGEACALTLDFFARINKDAQNGRVQEIAHKLGFADVDAMADRIFEMKKEMGMRTDLKDLNLTEEDKATLVKQSQHPNLFNNPVDITPEILDEMYSSMM